MLSETAGIIDSAEAAEKQIAGRAISGRLLDLDGLKRTDERSLKYESRNGI